MCRRWRSRQTCSTVTRGSNRACCTRSSRVCPKSSCGVVLGQRNWCAAATKYVINSAERLECSSLMPPWLRRAGSPLLMTKSRYSNAGRLLHHHHWCVDADVGGCFSTVKQFDGQRLRLPHGTGKATLAQPARVAPLAPRAGTGRTDWMWYATNWNAVSAKVPALTATLARSTTTPAADGRPPAAGSAECLRRCRGSSSPAPTSPAASARNSLWFRPIRQPSE